MWGLDFCGLRIREEEECRGGRRSCHGLGVRRTEECRGRKEKLPWVRSQENIALRAGQLELRAVQMKHST